MYSHFSILRFTTTFNHAHVPYEEQLRVAIRINNAYDIAQIDYQKNKLGYTHETSI